MPLKYVSKDSIDNKPPLVQVMTLPKPIMTQFSDAIENHKTANH